MAKLLVKVNSKKKMVKKLLTFRTPKKQCTFSGKKNVFGQANFFLKKRFGFFCLFKRIDVILYR